uniref:Uncharacterized protein n=1 Tax=Tanacetum cinerariifolium TaxID=118510 RepID=A0A699HGU3_TANCI|nr:hypothetical protein [Tanacetum cinerariifolium]
MEDHTSDWLKLVSIYMLGQTMNGSFEGISMGTMLYLVLLLLVSNIGITLYNTHVSICFRSGVLSDMLLYSWDRGLDVCVDLTCSAPLTQTEMVDFVSGRAVIEVVERKCVEYEAKCVDSGYGTVFFLSRSLLLWSLKRMR